MIQGTVCFLTSAKINCKQSTAVMDKKNDYYVLYLPNQLSMHNAKLRAPIYPDLHCFKTCDLAWAVFIY